MTDVGKKEGVFIFLGGFILGKKHLCKMLQVQRKDEIVFFGRVDASEEAVTLKKGDHLSLKKTIVLEAVRTASGLSAIIHGDGEPCPTGQIFDIKSRNCVAPN